MGDNAAEGHVDDGVPRKRTHSLDSSLDGENSLGLSPPASSRPRIQLNKEVKSDGMKSPKTKRKKKNERWITNQINEDYVNLVGDIMYPKSKFHYSSTNPPEGKFPLGKINTLGYLLCPLRKRSVLEKWSPFEVAVFEASITIYGKDFNRIHKAIQSKTCKEVIEFYYEWKKTDHYQQWKTHYKNYVAEEIVSTAANTAS